MGVCARVPRQSRQGQKPLALICFLLWLLCKTLSQKPRAAILVCWSVSFSCFCNIYARPYWDKRCLLNPKDTIFVSIEFLSQ